MPDSDKVRLRSMFKDIDECRAASRRLSARMSEAKKIAAEEAEYETRSREVYRLDSATGRYVNDEGEEITPEMIGVNRRAVGDNTPFVPAQRKAPDGKPAYDEVMRVGSEPRTYSRNTDPEGNGTAFLTDVIGAFRGNSQSTERLARHAREYEVDNKGRKTRAAGDVTTGALPNLVIPSYLYGPLRGQAERCATVRGHLSAGIATPEGMKVELAKGNTSATAALQTSELVAAGGGNYDADPLELSVQTSEAWRSFRDRRLTGVGSQKMS